MKTMKKPAAKLTVEIKNIGETAVLTHGGKIAFVTVDYDQDCSNPLEDMDAMGTIHSFSRRHVNTINPEDLYEYSDDEDAENGKKLREEYRDGVFLSYFEHGLCRWGVRGTMSGTPDFCWDGVNTAGIWVPDKYLLEEAKDLKGEAREKKMIEWAGQACSVYTSWCNGECFGYKVSAYKVRKADDGEVFDQEDDYRHEKPLADDSCWGYIGRDDLEKYMLAECVAPILTRVFGKKVEVTY